MVLALGDGLHDILVAADKARQRTFDDLNRRIGRHARRKQDY
jgi:hypothetical protein